MNQELITDREEILRKLRTVETGDELTVKDESGYKDNREVTDIEDNLLTFGDPIQQRRVIDASEGTVRRITDDPDDPLSHGYEITSLWITRTFN